MSSAAESASKQETYKPVKTILVSQPQPERSPFARLEKKYDLKIDWRPFIEVKGLSEKEFRKERIRPDEFSAIIFTSKLAIEHFFMSGDALLLAEIAQRACPRGYRRKVLFKVLN